jgi:hypothetical protein
LLTMLSRRRGAGVCSMDRASLLWKRGMIAHDSEIGNNVLTNF